MMRSMYSGVSGLKNHQTRMDVIGNNISNVNTTGFKSGRVTFSDMLSQTVTGASAPADNRGGTNPKQVGLGSSVAAIDLMFTDGSVQGTGKNTDLALSGNGLFVVKRGTETYYTRNGAFEFDADGNYVQPGNGLFVQGWMANDGMLTTTGEVGNIQIPSGKSMESQATKVATYVNNLNGDPDGYTIANMLVTYVDGTSEITDNYSPNEAGAIVLTFEHADGSEEKVTLDNTASYDFVTGKVVPGKVLYTAPITSVTATQTGSVNVVTNVGSSINGVYDYNVSVTFSDPAIVQINGSGSPVTLSNMTHGYQSGSYKVSGEITAIDSTTKKITLDTGFEITVNDVSLYEVGKDFPVTSLDVVNYNGTTGTLDLSSVNPPISAIAKTGVISGSTITVATTDANFTPPSYTLSGTITDIDKTNSIITLADGTQIKVASVTSYSVGQTFTSKMDNVTSFTKNTASTTYTSYGETTGTYGINGNYDLTGKIVKVTAAGMNDVDITLEDGTIVNVPKPTTFDYAVGDTFTTKLGVTSIDAQKDAKVTTANGKTTTLVDDLNVLTAGQEYVRKTTEADNTIKAIGRSTTPTFGPQDKEVASVTINTLDGKTLNGLLGQTYTANDTFYPSVVTTVTVFDSLGGSHDIPVLFSKTGENKWNLSLTGGVDSYSYTESDLTETTVTLTSNDLRFTTTGAFDTDHPGTATIALSYGNGAADQEVTLNLNSLTQYIGSSTINADADGHAAGTLASVSIDSSGIITGTYTNGVRQYEAQIAVAQFNNASGLTKTGESLYQESNNSGEPNVHTADDLGVTITPSALEMSNVDIANEFTDMIVTQRGFQGNSKVITVSDEMLETLINMKR